MEARKTIIKRIKEWLRQWSNKFRDVQATCESDLPKSTSRQVAGIKGMTIIYCSDHVCWNGKWHPACWLFLSQCPILLDLTLDTTTIWAASHSLEYDPNSTKRESFRRCATHLGWFFSNSGLWPSNDWDTHLESTNSPQVFVGSRPDWTHKQCTSSNEHPPRASIVLKVELAMRWHTLALKEVRRHIILEKGVSHL